MEWAWRRAYVLSQRLPKDVVCLVVLFLGPVRYLQEREIVALVLPDAEWQRYFYTDVSPCLSRMRTFSSGLFIHSTHQASSILFAASPLYLTEELAITLWREVRGHFVHAFTRISFQKAVVQKCFHPPLLPQSLFCLGLWDLQDRFRVTNVTHSSEVRRLAREYRKALFAE